MFGRFFRRLEQAHALAVSMTGVKMGDRVAFVGCSHGGRLAATAAKVGLSGHAVALVPDQATADQVAKGAAGAGVLIDAEIALPTRLPLEDGAFDLVVVDDAAGLMGRLEPAGREAGVREILRVLRPAGRVVVVGAGHRRGLFHVRGRAPDGLDFVRSGGASAALLEGGFKSVRTLAEREGLVFVEGIKPRPV
jgi:SAM-dependent methyltransferase